MTSLVKSQPADSAVVVVLFNPDDDSISHIDEQATSGRHVIAVSNGALSEQLAALRSMKNVELVDNGRNVGLARALNQGIEAFIRSGRQYVVLLDQDSRVPPGVIASLEQTARRLTDSGVAVGCVAPRLMDKKAPTAVVGGTGEPTTVATSGSMIPRDAMVAVGPMWEELFIDGIDHEWCFRAKANGFAVLVDRDAALVHHMGDAGIHIGKRFRPIHRSPFRHYHIVRNILWLQRCRYIPLAWRLKELAKLTYRMPVYLLVSADRPATARALFRAIIDGVSGPRAMPTVTA